MTAAPHTAPVSFSTLEEAIGAVRGRGMRLSAARRLVLEALFAADWPVSAQQLSRELAIDTTSVYRNLELLERHGLVRHVHLGHRPGLYVLIGRRELEYLYCEQCGKITPIAVTDLDPIRQEIAQRFGHHARFTHFAIVGLCHTCAAQHTPNSGRDTLSTPAGTPDPRRRDGCPAEVSLGGPPGGAGWPGPGGPPGGPGPLAPFGPGGVS